MRSNRATSHPSYHSTPVAPVADHTNPKADVHYFSHTGPTSAVNAYSTTAPIGTAAPNPVGAAMCLLRSAVVRDIASSRLV